MHIVDGALSDPVALGGAAVAVAGIGLGLRSLPLERIPAAGVLSASFFVASLIHVPLGPSSVHLILNGLAGLALPFAPARLELQRFEIRPGPQMHMFAVVEMTWTPGTHRRGFDARGANPDLVRTLLLSDIHAYFSALA